jgi:hypothetical protein
MTDGSWGQFILTDFRTGKGTVGGPYSQDGKDHRLSRRRCHHCVCSDLLAILAERAQMTPKRPRDTNQIAKVGRLSWRPLSFVDVIPCRLLALFGPYASGRQCPLIGEDRK